MKRVISKNPLCPIKKIFSRLNRTNKECKKFIRNFLKFIMLNKLPANAAGLKANTNGYTYLMPGTVSEIVEFLLKDRIDKSGETTKT